MLWHELDGRALTQTSLARMLSSFGIKTAPFSFKGKTLRGYKVADFEDTFQRYLRGANKEEWDEYADEVEL